MVEFTFAVDGAFGVGMHRGPAHLHRKLRELSGHVLSEARDKYHYSVLNKANIVVTGIGLYLRKDNARYCSLRNAFNGKCTRWRNSQQSEPVQRLHLQKILGRTRVVTSAGESVA